MPKRKTQLMTLKASKPVKSGSLVRDVRALIEQARKYVARSVDTTLAALYWQVGQRIQTEILKGKRDVTPLDLFFVQENPMSKSNFCNWTRVAFVLPST